MATYQELKLLANQLTQELGNEQVKIARSRDSFELSRIYCNDLTTRYFEWSQNCAAAAAANPDDAAIQALYADSLRQVDDIVDTRNYATDLRDAVTPVPNPFE